MAKEIDQEFVEYIVKSIVEYVDDVKVERKIDEMGVLLTLSINPADMGKIIGKEGKTAKAIRTLLRVLGAKNNARVNLKILEPEGSTRPQLKPQTENVKEDTIKEAKNADVEPETTPIEEEKATEIV